MGCIPMKTQRRKTPEMLFHKVWVRKQNTCLTQRPATSTAYSERPQRLNHGRQKGGLRLSSFSAQTAMPHNNDNGSVLQSSIEGSQSTVAMICWVDVCDGVLNPAAPVGAPSVSVEVPTPPAGVNVVFSDAAPPLNGTDGLGAIVPTSAFELENGTLTLRPGLSCALPT